MVLSVWFLFTKTVALYRAFVLSVIRKKFQLPQKLSLHNILLYMNVLAFDPCGWAAGKTGLVFQKP